MTLQRRNLPRDFTESSFRRKADAATADADVITKTATTSAAMARDMRADAATARVTKDMRANATAMVKDTKESATATKTRLVK